MPIYRYVCPAGHVTEDIMKMPVGGSPAPHITCSSCFEEAKFALAPTGAPKFKGSGFHATDYPYR
jgi:predicted nucleic acid-binding Zn ribbon protein